MRGRGAAAAGTGARTRQRPGKAPAVVRLSNAPIGGGCECPFRLFPLHNSELFCPTAAAMGAIRDAPFLVDVTDL